jgi:DNA primase large subunit
MIDHLKESQREITLFNGDFRSKRTEKITKEQFLKLIGKEFFDTADGVKVTMRGQGYFNRTITINAWTYPGA